MSFIRWLPRLPDYPFLGPMTDLLEYCWLSKAFNWLNEWPIDCVSQINWQTWIIHQKDRKSHRSVKLRNQPNQSSENNVIIPKIYPKYPVSPRFRWYPYCKLTLVFTKVLLLSPGLIIVFANERELYFELHHNYFWWDPILIHTMELIIASTPSIDLLLTQSLDSLLAISRCSITEQ